MQKQNYLHGGNIYKAAKELDIPYTQILDFSANINPLGFPHIVKEIITDRINDIVHYPDIEQRELKEAAAEYYGIDAKNILPGNGSVELINIALETLRPVKTIIPSPTFSEYARSCKNRHLETVFVNLRKNEFKFDIELFDNIRSTIIPNSILILCNPNNPTGKLAARQDLITILGELRSKKAYLMIDEAFMDFVDVDKSMARFISEYDNLIILKSITKFFAVPGLRLGFVLANPKLIKEFRKSKNPWNINTFAGFVGCEVLKGRKYICETRKYISREKVRLWENLENIQGLEPLYPEANFIFIKIQKKISATILAKDLRKEGVLIRNCSNYKFLDDSFFRVAVKSKEDNEALISVLTKSMNKHMRSAVNE